MVEAAFDLHSLGEDDRIGLIGQTVMSSTRRPVVAFIVETNEKADRYIEKLQNRFLGIRIIDRKAGPMRGTIMVRVGPPVN